MNTTELDSLTDLLAKTDGFIVTEYRGLTVAKLDELKGK